jgi:hypothetical protein
LFLTVSVKYAEYQEHHILLKFRVTFEDSISVVEKVKYLDSIGCMTIGFYDITSGMKQGAISKANRFPMLNWIRTALASLSTMKKNIKGQR